MPAPSNGHTHEEQAARGARGVRATVFSRYSSGHLPSGVEEDCKGEIGCGWCHSFAGTIPPESVELSEASRQVLPSPNGACRERHARARARYHCFDWLEIWLHAKTSKVTPGHTRPIDPRIPNIARKRHFVVHCIINGALHNKLQGRSPPFRGRRITHSAC